jgi:hypothetical protein
MGIERLEEISKSHKGTGSVLSPEEAQVDREEKRGNPEHPEDGQRRRKQEECNRGIAKRPSVETVEEVIALRCAGIEKCPWA